MLEHPVQPACHILGIATHLKTIWLALLVAFELTMQLPNVGFFYP